MMTAIVVVSVVFIAAAWDGFRRYVEALRFNQLALDRIAELSRDTEKLREQTQLVLSKLNATQASLSTRNVPRIAR